MNKQEAKKQFDDLTKALNIEHTFSFDDAWDYCAYKKGITALEEKIRQHPRGVTDDAEMEKTNPLKHSFADGCYIREITNPPNELIITKIHKQAHPFFLMKGDMSILTRKGPRRIKAPFHGITEPGTKRIIYTHSECIFVTVHATDKTNVKDIEDDVIAKDFDDVDDKTIDTELVK